MKYVAEILINFVCPILIVRSFSLTLSNITVLLIHCLQYPYSIKGKEISGSLFTRGNQI